MKRKEEAENSETLRKSSRSAPPPLRFQGDVSDFVDCYSDPSLGRKQSKKAEKEINDRILTENDKACQEILNELNTMRGRSENVQKINKENSSAKDDLLSYEKEKGKIINNALENKTSKSNTKLKSHDKKSEHTIQIKNLEIEKLKMELQQVQSKLQLSFIDKERQWEEKEKKLIQEIEENKEIAQMLELERDLALQDRDNLDIKLKNLSKKININSSIFHSIKSQIVHSVEQIMEEITVEYEIQGLEMEIDPITLLSQGDIHKPSTAHKKSKPSTSQQTSALREVPLPEVEEEKEEATSNDVNCSFEQNQPDDLEGTTVENEQLFSKKITEEVQTPKQSDKSKNNKVKKIITLDMLSLYLRNKSPTSIKYMETYASTRCHLQHQEIDPTLEPLLDGWDIYIKTGVLDALKETSKMPTVLARGLVNAIFKRGKLLVCTASGQRAGQKNPSNPLEGLHPPAMAAILEYTKTWSESVNQDFVTLKIIHSVNSMLNAMRRSNSLSNLLRDKDK